MVALSQLSYAPTLSGVVILYENTLMSRYIVEQVIGKIKNAYGSSESTRSYDMAVKMVLVKMIVYNWAFLIFLLLLWSRLSHVF
jgi:hypothetical protein